MGKLFQLPNDGVAVFCQIAPNPTISCFVKPSNRAISFSDSKHEIPVPPMIVSQIWQGDEPVGFEYHLWDSSEFFFYRTDEIDPAKAVQGCMLKFANIHKDGRICWGNNNKPNDAKRALTTFFNAPFNDELIDKGELASVDVGIPQEKLAAWEAYFLDLNSKNTIEVKVDGKIIQSSLITGVDQASVDRISAAALLFEENNQLPASDQTIDSMNAAIRWVMHVQNQCGLAGELFDANNWVSGAVDGIGITVKAGHQLEHINGLFTAHHRLKNAILNFCSQVQNIAAKVKEANELAKNASECSCRSCKSELRKATEFIDNAKAHADRMKRFALVPEQVIKSLKTRPLGYNESRIYVMFQDWSKRRKELAVLEYMKTASNRGEVKGLAKTLLGSTYVGAKGTFDAIFVSSVPSDLSMVSPDDHIAFGAKGGKCVVGFATRLANWRYKVNIGKKTYGLVTDDRGNGIIVSEIQS
jgi:hypothetical protein